MRLASAVPMQDNVLAPEDDAERQARQAENRDLTRKVWTSGMISAILVIGSLPAMTGLSIPFIPMWHNPWLQLVLTAPVQFWCGASFYVNAWKALKRHTATMDAGYRYGCGLRLFPTFFQWFIAQGLKPDVYYEAGSPIPIRTTLRESSQGTNSEMRKLMGLQAKTARDSQWSRDGCSIAEVVLGDIVLVRPGEKIPVDGEIVEVLLPLMRQW